MPATIADRRAEEHVSGRLEPTLTGDHPVAMGRLAARTEEPLVDRGLRLLALEEQRIVVRPAVEEQDHREEADASDTDHLHRVVDDLVAVQQGPAILQERRPVRRHRRRHERVGGVGPVDHDRRTVHDPTLAVDDRRQLRQLVDRVVVGRAVDGRFDHRPGPLVDDS